jgi:hypothetical protein
MASAHILITGTATGHNRQLREMVDRLIRVGDEAERLKATFDQAALGGDWAALAELLGIESVQDAEVVYNLLGSVVTELNAPFITQLRGRLG